VSFEAASRSNPYSSRKRSRRASGSSGIAIRFPVGHLQGGEVALPEVAVILLGLLRAHPDRDAAVLVPVTGLLFDLAAATQDVLLSGDLVGERPLCASVTGDVLHLRAVHVVERVAVDRAVVRDVLVGDERDVCVDAQAPVAAGVEHAEVL